MFVQVTGGERLVVARIKYISPEPPVRRSVTVPPGPRNICETDGRTNTVSDAGPPDVVPDGPVIVTAYWPAFVCATLVNVKDEENLAPDKFVA